MKNLSTFVGRCLNANGPAQIVGYAVWGVVLAGMLWDFDPKELYRGLLSAWAIISVLVLVSCIWLSKKITQELMLLDMVISAIILSIVAMHDPDIERVMYTYGNDGHFVKTMVSDWFTMAGLGWMVIHGAYLANLLQRQRMECQRFNDEH